MPDGTTGTVNRGEEGFEGDARMGKSYGYFVGHSKQLKSKFMNKVIWKFPIKIGSYCELQIPKDGQILTVQEQFNEPMVWALVNPESLKETRRLIVVGTGHEIPDLVQNVIKKYIGTFQTDGGNYVFHVFEIKSP